MDFFLQSHRDKQLRKQRIKDFIGSIFTKPSGNETINFNLEIGCGHGHWLTSYAENEPSNNFIGVDLITKRIEKAISKATKRNLKNIFFIKADAIEFLSCLPKYIRVDNCYIMYPDPWPKKKHHKRRLVQKEFLQILAESASEKAQLFFMTDHQQYFEWAKSEILNSNSWTIHNNEWPHHANSYFSNILPKNQFLCALRLLA